MLQRVRECGFDAIALTGDTPWFGNRERDPRNGFTIPANYTPRQIYSALQAPAWSFDFLSHPAYTFELLNTDGAAAETLTQTFNEKISKDYSWKVRARACHCCAHALVHARSYALKVEPTYVSR